MHKRFSELPKRLTVSFPLWLIYGTKGGFSPYYDIDRAVREHAERGFNCMRIDGGAGLIHDQNGEPREPFVMTDIFGEYERIPRQQHMIGNGGVADLLQRLIKTLECCKKYGVYVILSQWYYLHTYWFHKQGDPVADELFAIPVHEKFMAFAKFWHYILLEIEKRGLDDRIAFIEIFNEVNDHPYRCGIEWDHAAKKSISAEEKALFKKEHTEAIAWLKERHPNVMVGYDTGFWGDDDDCMPSGIDVYNFHSYYLWSLYGDTMREHPEWFNGRITPADVAATREGRRPAQSDWYERVALYNDMKSSVMLDVEKALEEKLIAEREKYIEKMKNTVNGAISNKAGAPTVCGEGVSYICSKYLLWEEKSDTYWSVVREMLQTYKSLGVWGSVIRTCMGPEDPCWDLCKDRIRELNLLFLSD